MRRVPFILLVAVSLAACTSAPPPSSAGVSPVPSATTAPPSAPSPTLAPSPSEAPSPTSPPIATPEPSETPEPTAAATTACLATGLAAEVLNWQGAAGHQIATITFTNTGTASCTIQGTPEVQLVDAAGFVLIDSKESGSAGLPHVSPGAEAFVVDPGAIIGTMVSAANYCGSHTGKLPTTVAFILPANGGRLVAAPGPGGIIPDCLASPGAAGIIDTNGWTR
jgi:hypothetical protein